MNRRGPLIAGIAAGVLALLMIFFLVLPKMNDVSQAQDELTTAEEQEQELQLELSQLEADKEEAPAANQEIRQIDNQIPPTVDQEGMLLLLDGAATRAGTDFFSVAPGTPTAAGVYSVIPTTVNVTGTYFALEEFLYNVETLPRAAKVLSLSLAPGGGGASDTTTTTTTTTTVSELSMQLTMEFYTTDTSAGPLSIPGPSEPTESPTEAPTGATGA